MDGDSADAVNSGQLSPANGLGRLSAGRFGAKPGTTLATRQRQEQAVLVMLDRAIPAEPSDARIKLFSSSTERVAAMITFPAAPASSSAAISTDEAEEASSAFGMPLVLVGIVVLLLLLLLPLGRRRRQASRHRRAWLPC